MALPKNLQFIGYEIDGEWSQDLRLSRLKMLVRQVLVKKSDKSRSEMLISTVAEVVKATHEIDERRKNTVGHICWASVHKQVSDIGYALLIKAVQGSTAA